MAMPFPFVYVCDLLEQLGELYSDDCPTLIGLDKKTNDRTVKWFQRHQHRLNEFSVDAPAVLMFFTPQRQTDRDYGLDGEGLEQLIARVLGLPRDLYAELQLWRQGPVHGDLGACVKRVMGKLTWVATQAATNKVTVEDIDQALLKIASHNAKSSPQVRSLAPKVKNCDSIELLGKIYRSLAGKEAKWFTRLILKTYGPIRFPDRLDISSNMQSLPTCVRVKATIDISDACPVLREGARLIKGALSGSKTSSFKRGLLPPSTVPQTQTRKDELSNEFANSVSTPPRRCPPKSIRESLTDGLMPNPSAISFTNKGHFVAANVEGLPTPPTTAPDTVSSTVTPIPTNHKGVQSMSRAPLATLNLNRTSPQQLPMAKTYESSTSVSSVSIARVIPKAKAMGTPVSHLDTPRISHVSSSYARPTPHASSEAAPAPPCHHDYIDASHFTSSRDQSLPQNMNQMIINGTGTCRLATRLCPLINCIFILSPCISSIPYITENLLSWHGSRTVTSIGALSYPSLPRCCPQTGKKYRKIALVETHRSKPTEEFIIQLSRLNSMRSRRRSGEEQKKEWVEVYDWRILEAITKIEQGQEKGYNPWRRTWVGAV